MVYNAYVTLVLEIRANSSSQLKSQERGTDVPPLCVKKYFHPITLASSVIVVVVVIVFLIFVVFVSTSTATAR